MDRTKALGVGLTILLAWGLPVSGQELRSDEIEEVLVQAACTVDGADQATLRRIAASQREEGIAAIGRLLCQPDRFAHGEGNEAYRLLVDGLLHTAVNSFGVPSALRALREPLVGSEDERVAYVFESPNLPQAGAGLWTWGAGVAAHARNQTMRTVAAAWLETVTPNAADLERASTQDPAEVYWTGRGWYRCATRSARADRSDEARTYYANALAAFKQAMARQPSDSEIAFWVASTQQAMGDAQAALDSANRAVAASPSRAQAYDLRAKIHRQLGNADQAREDVAKAAQARAEAREHQLRSAEGAAEELEYARNCAPLPFSSGRTAAGAPSQALEHYSNVVRYHPDRLDALVERGLLQLLADRFEGALADFSAYAKVAPDVPYVRYLRGRALVRQERQVEAAEDVAFWREHEGRRPQRSVPRDLPSVARTHRVMDWHEAVARGAQAQVESIPVLAEVLVSDQVDSLTRGHATQSLLQFPLERLQPVAAAADTALLLDPELGETIVKLIEKIRSPSSVPYLAAAACPDPEATGFMRLTALRALFALSLFPKEHAAPALQELVLAELDDYLAALAAKYFRQVDPEGVEPFLEGIILTGTRKDQVRAASVSTSTLAMLTLLEIVDDDGATERALREAAATALRRKGAFEAWVRERLGGG